MPRSTIEAVGSKARCGSAVLISNERSTTSVAGRRATCPLVARVRDRDRREHDYRAATAALIGPRVRKRFMCVLLRKGRSGFELIRRCAEAQAAAPFAQAEPAAPSAVCSQQAAVAAGGDLRARRLLASSSGRTRTGSADGSGSPPAAAPGRAPRRAAPRAACRVPSGRGTAPISASVYGCSGSRPQRLRRSGLDDHAEVHDRDDVGDVPDDREVVRDQQQAEREPAREVDEEVRDLRLRGRVERRERLVEHDHRRVGGERPGDRDPLPLAAAELVRDSARPRSRAGRRARAAPRRARAVRDAARRRARRARRRSASRPSAAGSATSTGSGRPSGGARSSRGRARRVSGATSRPSNSDASPPSVATSPTAARARLRLAAARLADEADDLAALDGEARARDRAHALAAAPLVHDLDVVAARAPGSIIGERVDVAGEAAAVDRRTSGGIVRRADVDA